MGNGPRSGWRQVREGGKELRLGSRQRVRGSAKAWSIGDLGVMGGAGKGNLTSR